MVDAKFLTARLADSHEVEEQVAFADIILLNKADLVPADELAAVEARIRAMTGDLGTVRLRANDGDPVTALAWSPDGLHLAVGTAGGMAASYDLAGPGRR